MTDRTYQAAERLAQTLPIGSVIHIEVPCNQLVEGTKGKATLTVYINEAPDESRQIAMELGHKY